MRLLFCLSALAAVAGAAPDGDQANVSVSKRERDGEAAVVSYNNTVRCSDRLQFVVLTDNVIRVRAFPSALAADAAIASAQTDRSAAFIVNGQSIPPPVFEVHNSTAEWCNVTIMSAADNTVPVKEASFYKPAESTPRDACSGLVTGLDVVCDEGPGGSHQQCPRTPSHPDPVAALTVGECCALCGKDPDCDAWVSAAGATSSEFDISTSDPTGSCFLLQGGFDRTVSTPPPGNAAFRTVGTVSGGPPHPTTYPAAYLKAHRVQIRSLENGANGAGAWSWRAGVDDLAGNASNLRGTLLPTPSTDMAGCCTNPDEDHGQYDPRYPLDLGVLSLGGWTVLDDSATPLVHFNDEAVDVDNSQVTDPMQLGWLVNASRPTGEADLYMFGCGAAFGQCLKDFSTTAGRIALPPRHALGIWWSRHWGDLSGNADMVSDPRIGFMTDDVSLLGARRSLRVMAMCLSLFNEYTCAVIRITPQVVCLVNACRHYCAC